MPCTGLPSAICGGSNANTLYSIEVPFTYLGCYGDAGPVSSTTLAESMKSSSSRLIIDLPVTTAIMSLAPLASERP